MPETPEIPEELPLAEPAAVSAEAAASAPECETPQTTHVPETTKEHEPMLDVHMPHATHTWKDFFIHIATICVGLLIAIGLEQAVEALHRHHQLNQLQEDLHGEALVNQPVCEINLAHIDSDTRAAKSADRTTWNRMARLAAEFLPLPRILHPWPSVRFAVKHPRWEPGA